MTGPRRGFSLIEAIFAIFLGALLVTAAWMALARQRQALGNMISRAERLATVRMARTALARDVSSAGRGNVWVGPDTIGLRAVRGIALVCAGSRRSLDPAELLVRYRGIRSPDASKDSLRGLTGDGDWIVVDLIDVFPHRGCDEADGARGLRLRASSGIAMLVYAEVFEVGSYHLSGRALRYRGPGGSRQPLTPENVEALSHFRASGRRLDLVLTSDELGPWLLSLGPDELR